MPKRPFHSRKTVALSRLLRKKARSKFSQSKKVFAYIATINELKSEIGLLTSYSTDTIYRLRYDSMEYDYISPSVIRLLGYTPDELRKINLRALILETRIVTDDMRVVESFATLEETRKKGQVNKWQADYLMRTKDGRTLWISDISYPWYDAKGAIIGSIGSLRDISERVESETRIKEELTRLANTDSLTGLAVRRLFFTRLEDELKRLKRTRTDLALLIIDVDRFKHINDTYGHAAGDRVLENITKIIQSCLRETDLASRLGGEEFGVLLPDTPIEGAYWVAERIRSSVAMHTFWSPEKHPIGCTVSVGVASTGFDEQTDSATLYKAADSRLFIAKNTGRNQVSTDELLNVH